ncbi:MAG: caspase family protein [Synechococcaceae cyanobacterium]|nr:caspase family protein [Synechococcaceae cyanobacterium]
MAKKALCIGINDYPGTQHDLTGCVNDAHDWARELEGRGFSVSQLLDAQATRDGMTEAIGRLVAEADSGDTLAITFSGHGTYAPDESGDEPDRLDEALCPYDIDRGNVLIDDEIHELFGRRRPGVRVLLISDSCHSGTVLRDAPADPDADAPRVRFLPLEAWYPRDRLPRGFAGQPLEEVALTRPFSPWGGVITSGGDLLLAGCEEGPNKFSYDASFQGRPNGAFTYYALKTLRTLPPEASYSEWHRAIRDYLPSANYPQKPQIMGTRRAMKFPVLQ